MVPGGGFGLEPGRDDEDVAGAEDDEDRDDDDEEDEDDEDSADEEDESAAVGDEGEVVGDCPVGDAATVDAASADVSVEADVDEVAVGGAQPHSSSPDRKATAGRPDRRLRTSTVPPSDGCPVQKEARDPPADTGE